MTASGPLRRFLARDHPLWRALIVVQLAAILVIGLTSAVRHHVWGELDERAHYDFIQKVAEDGRLPRPTDLVSPETQSIAENRWPLPPRKPIADQGLAGRSYEGMQPPLYYLASVPAFALVGDHRDKVTSVRLFNVVLLALSLGLLWVFVRRVAPGAALPALGVALTVVLWPGVIVRFVNIGNTPLEVPLTLGFLILLWDADRHGRWRTLAAAGALLGLCLLTKISLQYLVPLFAFVVARRFWRDRTRRTAARAIAVGVIPLLLIAPWIASNIARYEAVTVNILGQPQLLSFKEEAEPAANAPPPPASVIPAESGTAPPGLAARIGELPGLHARLFNGVLPQEWEWHLGVWWIRLIATLAPALIALAALVLLAAGRDRRTLWFLAIPTVTGLAVMNAVYLLTGEDAFQLRYLYPALLPLALAVGIGIHAAAPRGRLLLGASAATTVALGAVWVYVAGSHYFKDVGGSLGIPPGF